MTRNSSVPSSAGATLAAYRHTARTRRVLHSLVSLLCPPDAARPLASAIVDHVELSMRAMPVHVRAALVTGLAAYDLGALARHGRRANKLDPARAAGYLERWRRGPALGRELVQGVKGLLCLAYFEMPEVQARMGYRPAAWIDHVARRRRARYGEDIARHQASLLAVDPLRQLSASRVRTGEGEP